MSRSPDKWKPAEEQGKDVGGFAGVRAVDGVVFFREIPVDSEGRESVS